MNQLMENLFSLLETPKASEAEHKAINETQEAIRKVEQRLTCAEFEDFWNAVTTIEDASHLDSFTLGFRLGMQLTMEGLRPIVE